MKAEELIKTLSEFPPEMEVVLCDLNNDGDGDGVAYMSEIKSVETVTAKVHGRNKECIFINFK